MKTKASKKLMTLKLAGTVTVAFNKVKNLHICNALEFDIVGTGDTADQALAQVKELVEHYISVVVDASANGKKVKFFNPAIREMWNSRHKQRFRVEFILGLSRGMKETVVNEIEDLRRYSASIESINLVPAI